LVYRSGDQMMAVEVRTQPGFEPGVPKLLHEGRFPLSTTGAPGYDVSPSGRLLRPQQIEPEQSATQINIVINRLDDLKRRVPTK